MSTFVRTFQFHMPVFVWIFLIGIIVCFLLGYFQTEKRLYRTRDGRKGTEYFKRYGDDTILCVSAAFGLAAVITCLKYSITLPSFWLFKLVLFGVVIVAIVFSVLLLWGIAETAVILSLARNDIKK